MIKESFGNFVIISGFVIAIVLGTMSNVLGDSGKWLIILIVIFGFAAGFLKAPLDKSKDLLWFSAVLMVLAFVGKDYLTAWDEIGLNGNSIRDIFENILTFLMPLSAVVALRNIWANLREDKKE